MHTKPVDSKTNSENDELLVRNLYQAMLDAWNNRSAGDMAELYTEKANIIGFDGSQINGRSEFEIQMRQIFEDHQTASYIGIIREVRFIHPQIAILRAVVGMVPAGESKLNPAVNAVQTMVVEKFDGRWQIELFQNTPAQFHGRPDLSNQLTEELRQALLAERGRNK